MMSKQRRSILGIATSLLVICTCGSFSFAGPNLEEGLWEFTSKMEMPGMPMNMPPTTHRQCITNDNMVPRGAQESGECKMVESAVKGDTVTWTMECNTPEGKTEAKGSITYQGDTFKGVIKMSMQGMEMTQYLSGRRVGDCPE